jgi:hypothetical protein
MTQFEDPLLKKQGYISSKGYEYKFIGITAESIDLIDATINLLWIKSGLKKTTTAKEIIINAQSIFKNNDVKSADQFWMEHLSASLRELVDGHFDANCKRFFTFTPTRNSGNEEKNLCVLIRLHKDFLNDHAHFKPNAICFAKQITKNEKLDRIDEKVFDDICTGFLHTLESYLNYKNR